MWWFTTGESDVLLVVTTNSSEPRYHKVRRTPVTTNRVQCNSAICYQQYSLQYLALLGLAGTAILLLQYCSHCTSVCWTPSMPWLAKVGSEMIKYNVEENLFSIESLIPN